MDMIAQVMTTFLTNAFSSLFTETQADFGARMHQVLQAGNEMLTKLIPALLLQVDQAISKDPGRVKEWQIIRMDERTLVTVFGGIRFQRRYYRHRKSGQTAYLLDEALGITAYAKVGNDVRQAAVSAAEDRSYARSAEAASVSELSKMSVCNYVSHLKHFPELKAEGEKRAVKLLYVEADEDHVSLQNGKKVQKKLVYIHEGVREEGGRRELLNPHYLTRPVGEDSDALWEEVSHYIEQQYAAEELEHVFLSGDCASWIRKGEEWLYPCVPVLDRFHTMKTLRSLCAGRPGQIAGFLHHVRMDEQKEAAAMCRTILRQTAPEKRKRKHQLAKYLLSNWVRIRNQRHPGACGCSAEGHVSHVLSARLSSRPLGWSQGNLENMAQLRVMKANGQPIDYTQLRAQGAKAGEAGPPCHAKALTGTARFKKEMKKASGTRLKSACASIPALTTGKTSTLYQALHGLLAHSVA